jgi:hypothetical protein
MSERDPPKKPGRGTHTLQWLRTSTPFICTPADSQSPLPCPGLAPGI